jgi:hypothetical protein
LNKQVEAEVYLEAKRAFKRLEQEQQELGHELVWFIVDGFVLYWDKASPDRAE